MVTLRLERFNKLTIFLFSLFKMKTDKLVLDLGLEGLLLTCINQAQSNSLWFKPASSAVKCTVTVNRS